MRYQKKSAVAYMFRNFGSLFYVALPVAVAMGFFFNYSAEMELYKSFVMGSLTTETFWQELGNSLSVLRFANYWWEAILSLALLILTFSMLAIKIGKHMRVGEMRALPFKSSFRIFPTMALYVLSCFLCIQIVALIPIGIVYLLKAIQNVNVIMTICFAMVMITRVILSYLFSLLLIAFPIKYDENYKFNVALAYSARTMAKKKGFTRGFAFAYPAARLAVGAVACLLAPYKLDVIVYALFYFVLIVLLPCVAFAIYHDTIGGERRDLSHLLFTRR